MRACPRFVHSRGSASGYFLVRDPRSGTFLSDTDGDKVFGLDNTEFNRAVDPFASAQGTP